MYTDAMQQIRTSSIVRHDVDQMFELVQDVDRYPSFLNWCDAAEVLALTHHKDHSVQEATLTIGLGFLRQSFTTRNVLHHPNRIDLALIDGPFTHFSGHWQFLRLDSGDTRVSLSLDFDFANGLLGMAFRNGFTLVSQRLVRDFCQRAEELHASERSLTS